ncbi:hypothetical protein N7454_005474 [Penicillium verhagenii]|nr:hypothetical protein N7454_005474 [Penicillium verhagenii]
MIRESGVRGLACSSHAVTGPAGPLIRLVAFGGTCIILSLACIVEGVMGDCFFAYWIDFASESPSSE